jgi:hypothetical protein
MFGTVDAVTLVDEQPVFTASVKLDGETRGRAGEVP